MTPPRPARDTAHETYDYWRYRGRDWHFFEGMFRRIHPVPPVLDIGSGLGFFVECCQHYGVEAVGLELSTEGTRASAQRHVPVVRADLSLPLPFRDDRFGTVFAHHVFEHLPLEKERAVLREVRRVLRPGGFLFIASCSHHMDAALFAEEVHRGLAQAGRAGRVLRQAGAAADHPVHPFLPESAYLKAEVIALD